MGLVPTLSFWEQKAQVFLVFKWPYPKSGVGLLKIGFLAYPTNMGGSMGGPS